MQKALRKGLCTSNPQGVAKKVLNVRRASNYTICAQRAFAREGPGLMTRGESRPQVLPWSYEFTKRVTAAESIGRALGFLTERLLQFRPKHVPRRQ